jgi:hypothetical protein
MKNVKVGDVVSFRSPWSYDTEVTECTVTGVSDPKIVKSAGLRTFSGVTVQGRHVGGYLDQIVSRKKGA